MKVVLHSKNSYTAGLIIVLRNNVWIMQTAFISRWLFSDKLKLTFKTHTPLGCGHNDSGYQLAGEDEKTKPIISKER